jgi:hypothetical protein
MGERVFRTKVVLRVGIAHHRRETIGGHVDALDLVWGRPQLG